MLVIDTTWSSVEGCGVGGYTKRKKMVGGTGQDQLATVVTFSMSGHVASN